MYDHESWVAAASVAVATTNGETVLLDWRRGKYFVLNETGGVVWRLARRAGGATVAEIVAAVDAEYDAPVERVRVDVAALLERLRRDRLVSRAPGASRGVGRDEDRVVAGAS
jgi:Coenzyme PQQ synthesis protein D (PqqD)